MVAYFSKTFNKAERRYCVTRRELLAMVAAINNIKYYLCGRPFTVRTDHSALQCLISSENQRAKLRAGLKRCSHMSSQWYTGPEPATAIPMLCPAAPGRVPVL